MTKDSGGVGCFLLIAVVVFVLVVGAAIAQEMR